MKNLSTNLRLFERAPACYKGFLIDYYFTAFDWMTAKMFLILI